MNNRLIYPDVLRILATFFVIFIHVIVKGWYTFPVISLEWQGLNIYDSLSRFCVPIFFMISGIFFLDSTKQVSYRNLYRKKIFRILSALIFWGIIYILYSIFFVEKVNITITLVILKIITKFLFDFPYYHLWFLYSILGIYILIPLIRFLTKYGRKRDIEYFLLLFLLFGTCVPLLNYMLSLKSSFQFNLKIVEVSGFLGYFIAGYYFSKYNISHKMKYMLYLLSAIALIFTISGTYFISVYEGKAEGFLYNYILLNTAVVTFSIFIFVKNTMNKVKLKPQYRSGLKYISNCTFGIYLIHALIIDIFTPYFSITLLSVPLLTLFYFGISFLFIVGIKQIPVINKYII